MYSYRPVRTLARLLLIGLFLALAGPAVHAGDEDCQAAGDYSFVCGPKNAEDLVLIPGTTWILSSGMAADGALYLIDAKTRAWSEIYPGDAPRAVQDMANFGQCPGSPDPNTFLSHGLNLRPGADGQATLYVVGHGGREAIEVFDVDARGELPVLTWTGCVLTPDGMAANSVASSRDGSLLATIPLHPGQPISDALAGKPTGAVYAWSPGEAGFTKVPGTELPYPNGIEISRDGQEFFVASSGRFDVTAFSNSNPARILRRTEPFTFVPDNLHMDVDGKLLTAGLNVDEPACGTVDRSGNFDLAEFASCPRAFTVWAIDPQSMHGSALATGPANPDFSNITMAVRVLDELWIGTFAGDRVAYRTLE